MILAVTMNPCVDKTIYVRDHQPRRIHRSERVTRLAGGKGVNVARVVRKLGGEVTALVCVGGHTGRLILDLMAQEAIPTVPVWVDGESREVVTILEADSPDYAQTAYVEPGAAISERSRVTLFSRFEALMASTELLLLTGPAPDAGSTDIYATMVRMAHRQRIPVFLDSRGNAFREAVAEAPTLVKPNEAEAAEWRQAKSLTEEEQFGVIREMRERGVQWVVLTLGEEGAFISFDDKVIRARPPRVETVNPIASGDIMCGAMALSWMRGESPERIIRMGVAAGAANAAVWDAGDITAQQVSLLMEGVELMSLQG